MVYGNTFLNESTISISLIESELSNIDFVNEISLDDIKSKIKKSVQVIGEKIKELWEKFIKFLKKFKESLKLSIIKFQSFLAKIRSKIDGKLNIKVKMYDFKDAKKSIENLYYTDPTVIDFGFKYNDIEQAVKEINSENDLNQKFKEFKEKVDENGNKYCNAIKEHLEKCNNIKKETITIHSFTELPYIDSLGYDKSIKTSLYYGIVEDIDKEINEIQKHLNEDDWCKKKFKYQDEGYSNDLSETGKKVLLFELVRNCELDWIYKASSYYITNVTKAFNYIKECLVYNMKTKVTILSQFINKDDAKKAVSGYDKIIGNDN